MFTGALESEIRRWLRLNVEAFRDRSVFVGCSGNFTIEQLLGDAARAVHANDVSIYSHFVGHQLTGRPARYTLKDPAWQWLRPYLDENPGAAIVMLFELLKWDPEKNIYNRRVYTQLRSNWEEMFRSTIERLDRAKLTANLTSYRSSDIWDFVDEARALDAEGIFIGFLPFYKGGYERLYRSLEAILDWDRPSYQLIDQERKRQLVKKIEQLDHVIIDDVEYPEREPVMLKKKTGSAKVWLYSTLAVERVLVQPHTKSKPTYYPLLTDEDVQAITPATRVTIKRVESDEINYFRNRYLAKGIQFVNGTWNFLFFLDGKLFGFAILTLSKYGGDGLYLLSDFTIPLTDSRISKLLVILLQSTHFRDVAEELVLTRVPTIDTTAFTEKPVSMKYRGVFELVKRGQSPEGKKFLNYQTATGLHSDEEGIRKWMKLRKKSRS